MRAASFRQRAIVTVGAEATTIDSRARGRVDKEADASTTLGASDSQQKCLRDGR